MNPVERAIWYIESHFGGELSLDAIAAAGGVSRFHLVRAFGLAIGCPVMRYARWRRLSEAARTLAAGAPDILQVALQAGYGSHEAFTRAFRDQFGLTPEAVRAQRHLDNLNLMEPIKMSEDLLPQLEPPRFVDGKAMLLAGLSERYDCASSAGIPAQWQRFQPYLGEVPEQVGSVAYGVCANSDDAGNFDYIAAVEVRDFSNLPAEFARLRLSPRRYAVFTHRDHVSSIRRSFNTIFSAWLPKSGYAMADAPDFERYDQRFDPATGQGVVEIWIPIEPAAGPA